MGKRRQHVAQRWRCRGETWWPWRLIPSFNLLGFVKKERTSSTVLTSNSHVGTNGVGRRNAPRPRSKWNYGGGVGLSGNCYNNTNGGDTVGPRLSGRRTSSGSASNGNKTAGDEASSTAVSKSPFPFH